MIKAKQIAVIMGGTPAVPVPDLYALGEDGRIYVRRGQAWDVERWEQVPDIDPDDLSQAAGLSDDDETHSPEWNQPLTVDSDA